MTPSASPVSPAPGPRLSDAEFAALDYGGALSWLFARNQFSMKLGLEKIRALLNHLGSPDRDLAMIHVAGTNGKGSVCGNAAALLQASGVKRVGLYTSPHLVSFRERIRVDGEPIVREAVLNFIRAHGPYCQNEGITYFEIATAMALDFFCRQGCEAVVLETGLGGRLDATNAVRPKVSVITPVDIDHTAQLGPTLDLIFAEKAAILKPGIPMVVAAQGPGLVERLRAAAQSASSPLIAAENYPWRLQGESLILSSPFGNLTLPADLRPEKHQRDNLALACLAVQAFFGRSFEATPAILAALRNSLPAGRTQVLRLADRLPLVLDGAHNPHGLRALVQSLQTLFPGQRWRVLFAMMADKPVAEALDLLTPISQDFRFVPLWERYARAFHPAVETLETKSFRHASAKICPLNREALLDALRPDGQVDGVVVCGSLFLLGEVIPLLAGDYPELQSFADLLSDRDLTG